MGELIVFWFVYLIWPRATCLLVLISWIFINGTNAKSTIVCFSTVFRISRNVCATFLQVNGGTVWGLLFKLRDSVRTRPFKGLVVLAGRGFPFYQFSSLRIVRLIICSDRNDYVISGGPFWRPDQIPIIFLKPSSFRRPGYRLSFLCPKLALRLPSKLKSES